MPSIKTPIRFLEAITLDIISIPGAFMSKKNNAKYHLNYICPRCSKWRKSFRDPNKGSDCLWYNEWKNNNYKIRHFGILNWTRYYLGLETNLKKYESAIKNK